MKNLMLTEQLHHVFVDMNLIFSLDFGVRGLLSLAYIKWWKDIEISKCIR